MNLNERRGREGVERGGGEGQQEKRCQRQRPVSTGPTVRIIIRSLSPCSPSVFTSSSSSCLTCSHRLSTLTQPVALLTALSHSYLSTINQYAVLSFNISIHLSPPLLLILVLILMPIKVLILTVMLKVTPIQILLQMQIQAKLVVSTRMQTQVPVPVPVLIPVPVPVPYRVDGQGGLEPAVEVRGQMRDVRGGLHVHLQHGHGQEHADTKTHIRSDWS